MVPKLLQSTIHTVMRVVLAKGQLISKTNCQVVNSSKKRTNAFVFDTMGRVLIRFLEEIEDTKNLSKLPDL